METALVSSTSSPSPSRAKERQRLAEKVLAQEVPPDSFRTQLAERGELTLLRLTGLAGAASNRRLTTSCYGPRAARRRESLARVYDPVWLRASGRTDSRDLLGFQGALGVGAKPCSQRDQPCHVEYEIRLLRALYDGTLNVLCIWEALRLVLGFGMSLPSWISAYLGETSNRLASASADPDANHDALAFLFGLYTNGGRGNSLSRFRSERVRFEAVRRVHQLRFLRNEPSDGAYRTVATEASQALETKVAPQTVRSWYSKYRRSYLGISTEAARRVLGMVVITYLNDLIRAGMSTKEAAEAAARISTIASGRRVSCVTARAAHRQLEATPRARPPRVDFIKEPAGVYLCPGNPGRKISSPSRPTGRFRNGHARDLDLQFSLSFSAGSSKKSSAALRGVSTKRSNTSWSSWKR